MFVISTAYFIVAEETKPRCVLVYILIISNCVHLVRYGYYGLINMCTLWWIQICTFWILSGYCIRMAIVLSLYLRYDRMEIYVIQQVYLHYVMKSDNDVTS